MFVALRELRSARGRFALITGVVLLLALLVAGLSGLTAGLGHRNISAVQALGDTTVALSAPAGEKPSLDSSALTEDQLAAATAVDPGVAAVGIARISVTDSSGRVESVVALGLSAPVGELSPPPADQVLTSAGVNKALGGTPATVQAGSAALPVAGQIPDLWYAHSPVVITNLDTWHELAPRGGAATFLAADKTAGDSGIADQAFSKAGLTALPASDLPSTMSSYQAENGSLTLMSSMLMAISALVVGAFFTVWAVQRRAGVAIYKALGAPTRTLLADALGQAAIVLAVGVGAGVALAAATGAVIPDDVPYVVNPDTTLLPAVILVTLGLAGAAIALRPVLTADPTTALGALR